MNPIQQLIQARIDALIANSSGAGAVGHAGTTGSLRERLLIDFFKEMIPQHLSIASGIACDAVGRVSKQLDFMVKSEEVLPSMMLMDSVSIVPVDALYLVAEIKSTLTTEHLEEIAEAREQLNELETSLLPDGPVDIKVPSVVLAYESRVARDRLERWVDDTADVVAVCVIGSMNISKRTSGLCVDVASPEHPRHWEVLTFASDMFAFLYRSMRTRGRPLMEAYVRGVLTEPDGRSIRGLSAGRAS